MLKVPNGQDPYNVIGQYIQNHITAIEDIIATIEIDGIRTNELFMVDMQEDGYFIWKSDWYEGEKNVYLIDFFPVSEAQKYSPQVEIIYCRDCSYGTQDEYGRWFCRSLGCQIGNEDGSGFCADAERREE